MYFDYCFTLIYYYHLKKNIEQEDEIFATNLLWSQSHAQHFIINHSISGKWLFRTNYSHSTF